MATTNVHVEEMQGLYGPFTVAERVVQKIWLQRDFDHSNATLSDGRSLQIRTTGIWNLLGGPDFRAARLVIDGREITGDVEVHFHASDWRSHGHAADHEYDNVALHVVLFPLGADERPALRRAGEPIPTLVLLPLLHRDLEEYASNDALETITARDEWRFFSELAGRPLKDLQLLLKQKAKSRWQQKVHFAGLRIQKLGWEPALHHAALEILGYKFNRSAMLVIAGKYPLVEWRRGVDASVVFADNSQLWKTQGIRPANHPCLRLRQYQQWVASRPDWPERALTSSNGLEFIEAIGLRTKAARKLVNLRLRRKTLALELADDAIRGSRFDNLVCDGLLPLLASKTNKDFFGAWFHWFLGDVPDQIRRIIPKLGLSDGQMQPLCHGYAQGLLGWFLECEARASS